MATPAEVLKDDKFWGLPVGERRKVLGTLDPRFAGLPEQEQLKVVSARPDKSSAGPAMRPEMSAIMADVAKHPGILGGPVLPVGQAIPTAVGMATELAGRKLGLPEWANVVAGIITGGATYKTAGFAKRLISMTPQEREKAVQTAIELLPRGEKINKLRALLRNAPEPYKPGKGTGTKYGGPSEPEYSPPGSTIPRKGPPETPKAPPGRGTGTKYGGPAPEDYSPPGAQIPRRGLPERSPAPPGKGTRVKYGGSYEEELQAGSRVPEKGQLRRPSAKPASEGGEGVDFGDLPEKYRTGAARKAKEIAGNRQTKVTKIAQALKANGVSKAAFAKATPAQKAMAAKAAGYPGMSDITFQHVLDEL